MTKRFDSLMELGELVSEQQAIDEFEVSQDELDWYIDTLWDPISDLRSIHGITTTRTEPWFFRGIKLIVKNETEPSK